MKTKNKIERAQNEEDEEDEDMDLEGVGVKIKKTDEKKENGEKLQWIKEIS